MSFRDMLLKNGITPSSPEPAQEPASEPAANEGTQAAAAVATPEGEADIDEARIIASLRKQGIEINSLADLKKPAAEPTAAQKEAAAAERQAAVRRFALEQKKAKAEDFESFAAATAQPVRELAFEAWKEANYGDQPEGERPADEDLAEEFADEFLQYAEETDPKRLRKEKALQALADQHLQKKFSHVYGLDKDYESFVQEQQLRTTYNTTIEQAFQSIGDKLSFKVKEGKDEITYDFKLTPELINEAKANFQKEESFNVFGKSNMSAQAVKTAIEAGIKNKHLDEIISYVSQSHADSKLLANAKGRRGIPEQEMGTNQHILRTGPENSAMKRQLQKNKGLIA